MNNPKIIFTSVLLALACFTASPVALARPLPTPTPTPTATPPLGEDRGNGNSAAENVDALNISTTGITTQHTVGLRSIATPLAIQHGRRQSGTLFNTTGDSNTATGTSALYLNTSGTEILPTA